jgi:hypothetical protein
MKTLNRLRFPKFPWATNPLPNLPVISPKRDASISLKGTYQPHSSWSVLTGSTPSGSAGNESGARSITTPDETERAAVNAFLLCMVWVMAATGASFACLAFAYHREWLAAVLSAKLAAILWTEARREGRQSARLFAQLDADDHAS